MGRSAFLFKYVAPAAFFSLVINLFLLAPTIYMLQLSDRVIVSKSEETLWLLTGMLFVALLIMGLIEIVRARLFAITNNAIDAKFAPFLFRKMAETASLPEGSKYPYALGDLATLKGFVTGHGMIALFDAPWLPIYILILYFMNPILFYIIMFGTAMMLALTLATELLTRKPLGEAGTHRRNANRYVDLTIKNAEVVNAMGMLGNIIRKWNRVNNRALNVQTKASTRSGTISGLSKFLRQLLQSLAMGTGTYIILKDPTFTPGMMIAGGILFGKALGPIEMLIASWRSIVDARAAYRRLNYFIAETASAEGQQLELPPPTGQVSFEHVTFGIRTLNRVILKDVTFALEPGECLGIVGPSASGKSTLARLIVGVWKPIQGVIRIDGADLNTWPAERLGKHLGYLPQDIELFTGTVAENIARLDDPDSEKVIEAAKLAGLHDLILHLPNGYDTQIGDGGEFLSGGQRQRVALARALYGGPKLVVLDEPNSSLDNEGEIALVNALASLKEAGVTTVIITHNPNYLNKVDKLLVMQFGNVAAFGPKQWVLERISKQLN